MADKIMLFRVTAEQLTHFSTNADPVFRGYFQEVHLRREGVCERVHNVSPQTKPCAMNMIEIVIHGYLAV
jgi:hypothetical protein